MKERNEKLRRKTSRVIISQSIPVSNNSFYPLLNNSETRKVVHVGSCWRWGTRTGVMDIYTPDM